MSNSEIDNGLKPRLCHVKKWSDFNGYGFNLHAEKGKAGQFIGKVDPGSPAESAGLKEGDRIIEVNGTNIGNENHSQVVQRIKTVPNETKMLVVDSDTDAYFKEKKIVVRGDMAYVQIIECPDEKGGEVIRSSGAGDGEAADIADGPAPRQCHLVIWPDFQGYGFNLHAEKGKPGQFIGKVDPGSPSEAAGLKQGDRIVEVNGQFIGDDNHAQVVQKIKSDPSRTTMLVVDEVAENYYRQRNVKVSSSMANTKNIYCPASKADYQKAAAAAPASGGAALNNNNLPASAPAPTGPAPRLCHLKIWRDFPGYGFNLQSRKGAAPVVGNIDEGSPAEAAGLREGDRVIEVNGEATQGKEHQQVIHIVKADPRQTMFLVVDAQTAEYFAGRGEKVYGGMVGIQKIVCPDEKPKDSTSAKSDSTGPAPRLCILKIWPDYQGYGFNLHAEKEKGKGQRVGKVDAGSPAERAGLKEGDKIVEVNGKNVANEDHRAVVTEIKADATRVQLLVVDSAALDYYTSRGQTISSSMSNVERIECPDSKNGPSIANGTSAPVEEQTKAEVNHNQVNGAPCNDDESAPEPEEYESPQVDVNENEPEKSEEQELDELQDYEVVERREKDPEPEPEPVREPSPEPAPVPAKAIEQPQEPIEYEAVDDQQRASTAGEQLYDEAAPAPTTPVSPSSGPVTVGGIEFAGSAKEAREKLSKRSSRKHEVKKQDGVSMRDKFELFQKL